MKVIFLALYVTLFSSVTSYAMPITSANLGVVGNSGNHTIDTNGSNFDTELGIWDASGNLLGSNDDGGTGLNSLINTNFDSGHYYLGISEFNSVFEDNFINTGSGFENGEVGNFNVNIDNVFTTAGVGSDQLAQETNFLEFFILDFIELGNIGTAGNYTFDTNGSNFDTELGIWDAFGNFLGSNDDGGTGLNSLINIDLTSGDYYLGISEFNSVFQDNFINTGSGFENGEVGNFNVNIDNVFTTAGVASDQLYQETYFINFNVTDVPEPSTLAIFALGMIGLASRKFKKQS